MLGRTHMAVGALGAALIVPLWLHETNAHTMMTHAGYGALTLVEQITAGIVAGALGGILPDLDQKDALMTRRIERVGKVATLLAILGLLGALHLWDSPAALGVSLVTLLAVTSHAEWMRKSSLLLLAAGVLGWGLTHRSWFEVAVLMAVWLSVTAFSPHRTFTHSLIGLAMAGVILVQVGIRTHLPWLADAAGLGYFLHLVADAIAGGIPLVWPYSKRQGMRWVRTGSVMDHWIGGLCTVLMVAVLFM
ncbi:metal-dependent hydrolase [Alicyclobacillus tolerans]|uniref:metal-dependent hydrolase n=1 Tax=Alicyclobacillus tolerans TaxID=90970 RepID=UPI001F351EEF|nr:metal-dependent hydrolase [Alicyclobacillus tolerans]MCF8567029.1 metal-dependent hydrolase [Alicyclobacillus tolerans]